MNSYLSALHMRLILRVHPKNLGANCCTRLSWPELKPHQVWYYIQWTECSWSGSKSGGIGHVEKYPTMHCFRLPRTIFIILTEYLWEFQRQIAIFVASTIFLWRMSTFICLSTDIDDGNITNYCQHIPTIHTNSAIWMRGYQIIVNKVNTKLSSLSSIYQQKVITLVQTFIQA